MPDNSATIADLEALLNSGANSIVVDGVTVGINHAEIRKRLRALRASDTSESAQPNRRPVAATINLSNQ